VTGIDAAPENIAAAKLHAEAQGLAIDYRAGGIEALEGRHDLVTCLEVVEHVADVDAFLAGLAGALAENGLLILSTPNRTTLSRLALITVGEGTGRIPKGTHDWRKFLTPEELTRRLAEAGLEATDVTGLGWTPTRGFLLTEDVSLNYLLAATRTG
jgi:2-polyprenyl-6-hydroxyphenyl methylase/3-demethylubiquinone-9 3-methyltransferase